MLTRTNPIRSRPFLPLQERIPRKANSFAYYVCSLATRDLALTAYGLSVLGDAVRQSSTKGQTGLRTIVLAVLFPVSSANSGARISGWFSNGAIKDEQ